jgi:hypothetical protein
MFVFAAAACSTVQIPPERPMQRRAANAFIRADASHRPARAGLAGALLCAVAPAAAQPLFVQRLSAGPNAIENGYYGYGGVATDDMRLIVGESNGLSGTSPAVQGGAAEIWRFDGGAFVREQRIVPALPVAGGLFAARVALDGDWVALLDPSDGSNRVRIHRHVTAGWVPAQTLDAPPQASGFGIALALRGDLLAVGADSYSAPDSGIAASGAVYLYRRQGDTWQPLATLEGNDASAQRQLGASVALSARADGVRMLAAGAPGRGGGAGAVYVFREDGAAWVQEQRLLLSNPQAGEGLGSSVALRGATLLAGAPQATVGGFSAGRVALWRRRGSDDFPWVAEATIGEPAPADGDKFGQAVALSREDEAVVGAPFRDAIVVGTVADAGMARLFRRTRAPVTCAPSWSDAGGIGNPNLPPQAGALYGAVLAAGARLAAIAAIGADVQAMPAAGAVDAMLQDRVFDDAFDCPP